MPSFIKFAAAALAVAAPLASAQTYTDCNPLEKTCPADAGSTESHLSFDFTQSSALDKWTTTAGTVNTGSNGAEFTLAKRGDAPTIETDFYILFGEISITMKAAPGQGIVSSLVFESDDLDEIDWEALGGDTTQIETNYFGKGDTSTYDRATWPAVSDPQNTWHTYKISWQEDATTWYIDGAAVRTLNYADAKEGTRYPQTPMRIRIGIWAGGDPSNGEGTIEWAGGETNYAGAPYTMYVKNVDIVNANPAESYTWTDKTGSYQSIKKSGAAALSQSSASETSTASSSTTSSSTESKSATEASTTATTLATTTQTSTAVRTTAGSTTGSSSKASTTGSSAAAGSSSGSSTAGSGSGSGSGSSTTAGSGSSSSSSSSSAAAATTSPAFNGAASLAVGPLGLLAVLAAFIQL
jgi:beta-glucanase (GH16 family)